MRIDGPEATQDVFLHAKVEHDHMKVWFRHGLAALWPRPAGFFKHIALSTCNFFGQIETHKPTPVCCCLG